MSDTGNVISAFSEEDVERLTGITINQLRYWDRTGFLAHKPKPKSKAAKRRKKPSNKQPKN